MVIKHAINPERGAALLCRGAARLRLLGDRACHYAMLGTASAAQDGKPPLFLRIGAVQFTDEQGGALRPGPTEPLQTERTPHGFITYQESQISLPPWLQHLYRKIPEDDAWDEYSRGQRGAAHSLRALAAVLLETPQLPVSSAWGVRLDTDNPALYAQIHLPEDTTPDRMKMMLAFQGHTFAADGSIEMVSSYRPYDDIPFVVHYQVGEPAKPEAT